MIDAVVALAPTPGLTAGACAALNLKAMLASHLLGLRPLDHFLS